LWRNIRYLPEVTRRNHDHI